MSRLLQNTAANFAARVSSSVLTVIAVPLYLRIMGQESFGLMAFMAATQSLLSLLDLGLAATANREVARETNAAQRADLFRTLETIYWGTAVAVLVVLLIAATVAACFWLNLGPSFSPMQAWIALALASAAVSIRWPVALYLGVMQGLERQVRASIVVTGTAIIRIVGGIAVAAWVNPTVTAVFTWYIVSAIFEVCAARYFTVNAIGRQEYSGGHFQRQIISRVWKVAAGFSLVGALGTLGASLDKFLLARHLSVAELGIYSSIAMLASALPVVGTAVSVAAFPRLARAFGKSDEARLLQSEFSNALSLILWGAIPVFCLLVFGRTPLLALWTGAHPENVPVGATLVVLSLATLMNAIASPFYTAVMASGRTALLLVANSSIVAVLVPFLWILLPRYGFLAAAGGVLLHNIVQLTCVMARFSGAWPKLSWWWVHFRILITIVTVFIAIMSLVRGTSVVVQVTTATTTCVIALLGSASFVPGLSAFRRKISGGGLVEARATR